MSIDLDRRPATYWPDGVGSPAGPSAAQRAEMRELGREHPAFMGGAYLPEADDGEVEIARVALRSVTADVIGVWARPADGGIGYRVVDEYPESVTWRPPVEWSATPLSVAEMARVLRETYMEGEDAVGISQGFRERNALEGTLDEAEELIDFVSVSSDFYPELEELDRLEAEAWAGEIRSRVRAVEDVGRALTGEGSQSRRAAHLEADLRAAQAAVDSSGEGERSPAVLQLARALRASGAYSDAVDTLEELLDGGNASTDVRARASVELATLWACEGDRPDRAQALLVAPVHGEHEAFDAAHGALRDVLQAWAEGSPAPSVGLSENWEEFAAQDPQTATSLALGLVEVLHFAGSPDNALHWSSTLTRGSCGASLGASQRLRLDLWFMRAAHSFGAQEAALTTTLTCMPAAMEFPRSHPVVIDFLSQATLVFGALNDGPLQPSAYVPVLADEAGSRAAGIDPFAVRVINASRAAWAAARSPEGKDLGPHLRAFALRGVALGLYVPRWSTDLFSCVMKSRTARDMLGALVDGRAEWSHANVGLVVRRVDGGGATLTFPAVHPDSDDHHVQLDPEQVTELQEFAARMGIGAPLYATVGRNDPCPCGSAKKYKRCCGAA